jgi:hypothetical protein
VKTAKTKAILTEIDKELAKITAVKNGRVVFEQKFNRFDRKELDNAIMRLKNLHDKVVYPWGMQIVSMNNPFETPDVWLLSAAHVKSRPC